MQLNPLPLSGPRRLRGGSGQPRRARRPRRQGRWSGQGGGVVAGQSPWVGHPGWPAPFLQLQARGTSPPCRRLASPRTSSQGKGAVLRSPDRRGRPCSQEVQCALTCPEGEEGAGNASELGFRRHHPHDVCANGASSQRTGHQLWDACVSSSTIRVGPLQRRESLGWGGGSMGVCGAPSRVLAWDVCVHACDVSCGVWVPTREPAAQLLPPALLCLSLTPPGFSRGWGHT